MGKVIINCAITGSIHVPTMSPYLPLTPKQISENAIAAAEAGAATVHLHARDPNTGQPTMDLDLFQEFCQEIHRKSDVVICITTGGGTNMTPEDRMTAVRKFKPELGSLNMGSINFALFPMLERKKMQFKYEWEEKYLEATRDFVFKNTFYDMERILKIMRDNGTKPEMECYDMGHLYNTAYWLDKGAIDSPLWIQLVLGITGAIQPSIDNLLFMKNTMDKLFGKDYVWSVLAVGRHEFTLGTVGVIMGGNVRVGMEDNLYVGKGQLARSNADLVKKMVQILRDFEMEPASPKEAREILKLKGKEGTTF